MYIFPFYYQTLNELKASKLYYNKLKLLTTRKFLSIYLDQRDLSSQPIFCYMGSSVISKTEEH